MEFKDLINESGLTFTDISTEERRVYHYDGKDDIVIDNPIALNVSKSGGHRLLDGNGVSIYIPKGWKYLSWKVKDGCPHFVK